MAVNKNFVVKNGLEVGTDLIIAPTDVNKVGIGSTVPNAKLVVAGDLYATDVKFTGIGTVEGVFDVGINGSALNVNPSTGVIGIHTDTPSSTAAVDIRGQVEIVEGNAIIGQSSGNATGIRNYIKFGRSTGPKAGIGFVNTLGNGKGSLIFMNNNDNSANGFGDADEVMRLTNTGRLGLGTDDPSQILHVSNDTNPAILLNNSNTDNSTSRSSRFALNIGNAFAAGIRATTTSGSDASDASLQFGSGGDATYSKMRILANGNVGINESNPSTTLDVNGTVTATTFNGSFNGSYSGTLNNAGVSTIGIITGTSSIQVTDVYASTLYGNGANLTGIDTSGNFAGEYISAQGLVASNPGVITAVSYDGTHANFTGVVTATSFVGDGANLTNTGSTLGTGSGVERVVMTSLTSGTMILSDTDPNLVYDFDNDRFGIGTTSPNNRLSVYGGRIEVQTDTSQADTNASIFNLKTGSNGGSLFTIRAEDTADNNSNWEIKTNTNEQLKFTIGPDEAMRLDGNGMLLVGSPSQSATTNTNWTKLEVKNSNLPSAIDIVRDDGSIAESNSIGELRFWNNDGGTYDEVATIQAAADGDYSTGDKPGRLVFSTTADGEISPTERMRIGSDGNVNFTGDVTATTYIGSLTNTLTAGSYLTGTSYNNSSEVTFAVDATSANTANKVVARDGSGNFSAGTITASLSGTATNATNANLRARNTTNATHYITFGTSTSGNQRLNTDTGLTYNPSTDTLTVAEVNGNAATATNADNAGLLDGIDSSSFLRSDEADTASSKITFNDGIRLNDNDIAEFGSSADYTIKFDGSNTVHNAVAGDIFFQEAGTSKIFFDMSTGNILPTTDNSGAVGTSGNTWKNGNFTNFTVNSTLNVRGAIDLQDNDILRFGSGDDVEFFFDGSNFYLDLNDGGNNFIIRDGTTTRFTFDDAGIFTATGNINGSSLNASSNIESTGTGYVGTGQGAGGAFLTINDGGGNANVTFNHRDQQADQDGNAFRITGNTDSNSNAKLEFDVYENITQGNNDGTGGTVLTLTVNGGTKSATVSGNLTVSGTINNDGLVSTGKAIAMAMIFG